MASKTSSNTTTTEITFSALTAPEAINARGADATGKGAAKAGKAAGIAELAASIDARGLVVPLVVRPADGRAKRYEVIDGRRRFLALQLLVRDQRWSKSDLVPVVVREEDDETALETSLIANIERAPMHPVDQHAVFTRLADRGRSPAEIGASFGLAERTVRQRLALGRLAPKVREAWKAGRIDEKAAQAFTLADNQSAQEAALASVMRSVGRSGRIDDWHVKRELTGSRPSAARVPPVLVDAYLAAGGTITESLFEDERLIDEPAVLKQVLHGVAEARRAELLAEGWSWVALASELPDHRWRFDWDTVLGHDATDEAPLTRAEQARYDELGLRPDDDDDAAFAEQERILDRAKARLHTPELRARSGVVIDDRNYGLECAWGLIRPEGEASEDTPTARATREHWDDEDQDNAPGGLPATEPGSSAGQSDGATKETATLSNALVESVTTWQTLAVADALPASPRLALKAAIAALTCDSPWSAPLTLRIDARANLFGSPRSGAGFAATLAGLDGLSDVALLDRFARLMAGALDLVARHAEAERDAHAALVDKLPADAYLAAARQRFLAEDYFKRAPREASLAALDEMVEAGLVPAPEVEALADARKTDVADVAARAAGACGWLPPLLRHTGYELSASTASINRPGAST